MEMVLKLTAPVQRRPHFRRRARTRLISPIWDAGLGGSATEPPLEEPRGLHTLPGSAHRICRETMLTASVTLKTAIDRCDRLTTTRRRRRSGHGARIRRL